jgi:hypothetical protein
VSASVRLLLLAAMLANASLAADTEVEPPPAPAPGPIPPPPASPPTGLAKWLNPATAPFIPVPLISVDPDSGTTLGLIPTWVKTDENHEIRRIIAPDVLYNPYFGVGVHGRVYGYTSADEQWSVVSGVKERVEREFNAEYQSGRLREDRWSTTEAACRVSTASGMKPPRAPKRITPTSRNGCRPRWAST